MASRVSALSGPKEAEATRPARIVLAVAVVVALVGAVAGLAVKRQRTADRRTDERRAAAASKGDGAAAGGTEEDADEVENADEDEDEDDDDGGLVGRLLDALGGGGEAGGGATTALREDCASALASAPVGSAGFLPERGAASAAEQLEEIAGQVQALRQPPLCATMTAWYGAVFPGGKAVAAEAGERLAVDGAGQDAVIRCACTEVRLGIAPDLATARTIAGGTRSPRNTGKR